MGWQHSYFPAYGSPELERLTRESMPTGIYYPVVLAASVIPDMVNW